MFRRDLSSPRTEALLELLLGRSGGYMSSGAIAARAQATWWINAATGSPSNDGLTPATAIDGPATIRSRWTGGVPPMRPQLNPTGGTVVFHIVGTIATSDPLAVLLDVDLANGSSLFFQGEAQAPVHIGTIATASVFARTSAGGQVHITDSAISNFASFVPSMIVDTTAGAAAFLALPNTGSSATGTVSPAYELQTPGVFAVAAGPTIINPGDNYEVLPLATAYLGPYFSTRAYPTINLSQVSQVFFYRLNFSEMFTSDAVEFCGPGQVDFVFQECILQQAHAPQGDNTAVSYINCAFVDADRSCAASETATVNLLSGFAYAGPVAGTGGGSLTIDADFAVFGVRPIVAVEDGIISIGNTGGWLTGGGGEWLAIEGGSVIVAPIFQATAVAYGSSPGGFIDMTFNPGQSIGPSYLAYRDTGSGHAALDHFQFNNPTVGMLSTPFSYNLSTGVPVGPTTATINHLDATPASAGTALAGLAFDLKTGARIVQM